MGKEKRGEGGEKQGASKVLLICVHLSSSEYDILFSLIKENGIHNCN